MLISNAYAQTAATVAAAGSMDSAMQYLPIILMVVAVYFFMIRPQQQKAKEHKALIDSLGKGDEVVTGSGIAGRITKVGDDFASIEIAPNVEIQMQKSAIAAVLPKGSLKNQ